MTKKTLEKLNKANPQFTIYLDQRRALYQKNHKKEETRAEIRGYLAGLRACKIITDAEFRALYAYYTLD